MGGSRDRRLNRLRRGKAARSAARRIVAGAAVCLSGCDAPSGPYTLEPADLSGNWSVRSSESAWCEEFGPRLRVDVRQVEEGGFGRLNLAGLWTTHNWEPDPAAPVPLEGRFTGSVSRSTGEFEMLMWELNHHKGIFRGRFGPADDLQGEISWAFCKEKVGERVGHSAGA